MDYDAGGGRRGAGTGPDCGRGKACSDNCSQRKHTYEATHGNSPPDSAAIAAVGRNPCRSYMPVQANSRSYRLDECTLTGLARTRSASQPRAPPWQLAAPAHRAVPGTARVPALPQGVARALPEDDLRGAVDGDGRAGGGCEQAGAAERGSREVDGTVPRSGVPGLEQVSGGALVEDELGGTVRRHRDTRLRGERAQGHGSVPNAREPVLCQEVVGALEEDQLGGTVGGDGGAGRRGHGAEGGEVNRAVPGAREPGLGEVAVVSAPEDQLGAVLGGGHRGSGAEDAVAAEVGVGDVERAVPDARVPGLHEVARGALPEDQLGAAVLGDGDPGGGGESAQLGEPGRPVPDARVPRFGQLVGAGVLPEDELGGPVGGHRHLGRSDVVRVE